MSNWRVRSSVAHVEPSTKKTKIMSYAFFYHVEDDNSEREQMEIQAMIATLLPLEEINRS